MEPTLENLSVRKLTIFISVLLICQLACFLTGGLIAPTPYSGNTWLATKCRDRGKDAQKWFWTRGIGHCETFYQARDPDRTINSDENIVFALQIPLPRNNKTLHYSRWQRDLIGLLQFDVQCCFDDEMEKRSELTIDATLAYRNEGDPYDSWKHYASSVEERLLHCTLKKEGSWVEYYYCSPILLFDLGSLYHDFYLLNMRFPVDSGKDVNIVLGNLEDIWLTLINKNSKFTKVWLSLKTVFFLLSIGLMIWFQKRARQLSRHLVLLEHMLMFLGLTLMFLNMPLEYLTLVFDMPFMLLLDRVQQNIFYAALLSFWLVFVEEHLVICNGINNTLWAYWKQLITVAIGCLSLFIFDMCERGVELRNPFHSIWGSNIGKNLALTFIIIISILAGLYFFFLSYMMWKVFSTINTKCTILPNSSVQKYGFRFLMLATLLCAVITVIGFILGQVSESMWKWDDELELEFTSAFFTGEYGMWNIYVFSLFYLMDKLEPFKRMMEK